MNVLEQIRIDIARMLVLSEQKGNLDARIVEQCKVKFDKDNLCDYLKAKNKQVCFELETLKTKYL